MPRRKRAIKREILPDPKYNSATLAKFISKVMQRGKKGTAQQIVYQSLDIMGERMRREPLEVFELAIRNATPMLEVRPRRVGGATYQVPVEVRSDRRLTLAMRWILKGARARSGRPMAERLAAELMDAANNTGVAVKRKEDTHKMAEANRAFAHYRW
ncbi:MAG: 30S ribosomal protein S7 [Chloroflexi bacterium]|nr:30S ribosomal protein S7 [Chloroflexota bacterium]MBU1750923.1 30S ribosomal protein S7 [Chloroflexota bacterium]